MRHDVHELAGTTIRAGRLQVRPVAQLNVLRHEGLRWNGGASYLRPVRVEVTEGDGRTRSIPIPDTQMQIRMAAIAVVGAALLIGRMRRWIHR